MECAQVVHSANYIAPSRWAMHGCLYVMNVSARQTLYVMNVSARQTLYLCWTLWAA